MTCTVNIIKDGEIYVAEDTWTHVASEGNSMESALLNLKEALELYYEDDEHPDAQQISCSHAERSCLCLEGHDRSCALRQQE